MDDIVFQEYEANVNLLTKPDVSKAELDAAFGTLATILYSLMHSANEQIEEGVSIPHLQQVYSIHQRELPPDLWYGK